MKTKEQAEKEILNSDWTVKSVKFMKGHDADSMECSLYYKGKKVAIVWDDSWGGGYQYTWDYDVKDKFHNYAKSITVEEHTYPELFPNGFTYSEDCVVDVLVNNYELIKFYKRKCKTHVLFFLKKESKNILYEIKGKLTEKIKNYLCKKYNDSLVEIVNERF